MKLNTIQTLTLTTGDTLAVSLIDDGTDRQLVLVSHEQSTNTLLLSVESIDDLINALTAAGNAAQRTRLMKAN
jgi:hypothetical protein